MRYPKWIVVAFYFLFIGFIIFNRERLMEWIQTGGSSQLLAIFLCAVLFAAVPFFPFGLVGAVIGAKYGFLWGGLINLAVSTLAAVMTYYVFRYVFKNQGMRYLLESNRMQTVDRAIRNNLFWAVLAARIIPIMPAFLINCYAGVFGLPIRPFLLATVIGKIPAMLVFAYIGDRVFSGARHWIGVVLIYLIFLIVVYFVYRTFTRRGSV